MKTSCWTCEQAIAPDERCGHDAKGCWGCCPDEHHDYYTTEDVA